ncbi:MAG: hypothetical protein RIR57_569, partial [Bacteroidota bacterium]
VVDVEPSKTKHTARDFDWSFYDYPFYASFLLRVFEGKSELI